MASITLIINIYGDNHAIALNNGVIEGDNKALHNQPVSEQLTQIIKSILKSEVSKK